MRPPVTRIDFTNLQNARRFTTRQLHQQFLKSVTSYGNFHMADKPILGFKKLLVRSSRTYPWTTQAIANLIIPVGATLYKDCIEDKIRSNCVIVESIVEGCGVHPNKTYKKQDWSRSSIGFYFVDSFSEVRKINSANSISQEKFSYTALGSYHPITLAALGGASLLELRVLKHEKFKDETCLITPVNEFSYKETPCGSGIHFFIDIFNALQY